jgi:hypothetical protein
MVISEKTAGSGAFEFEAQPTKPPFNMGDRRGEFCASA